MDVTIPRLCLPSEERNQNLEGRTGRPTRCGIPAAWAFGLVSAALLLLHHRYRLADAT